MASRLDNQKADSGGIETVFWYLLVAIVPATMLGSAYLLNSVLPYMGGFRLVFACLLGFYVPYLILTPVRVPNQFFPMKEGGAELPFLMAFLGAFAGVAVGIVVFIVASLPLAIQVGGVVGAIVFHRAYYSAIRENYPRKK